MKTNESLIVIPSSHIQYMKIAKAKKHKADSPHFIPLKLSRRLLLLANLLLSVSDEEVSDENGKHL